ncbi:catechol 2,3-dioxygenase-like lactoylglutathione lyase family enzyme [Microbacterium sp. W4I4]|uniref:VOC family protein n=1 Tax=Microbacterium sp. W4I4 TaxID=3042295 RepID=UPI00278179C4|nr:VOC family protein [Microbacterium sp. W4I4]MDQ0613910.1 catechol 2,3-dioxygenase-like lactoylglutathione lyase family enzyme [Microbacterium sp. W4I4]
MALLDHLGISVLDIEHARRQFHPVLTALGYSLGVEAPNGISWDNGSETEIIIFGIRDDAEAAPHRHGEVGWQHLAFAVGSREEVDRVHGIAVEAGWTIVREPKIYTRFNDRYYASFVEDESGIRIEFMHNPPRDAT